MMNCLSCPFHDIVVLFGVLSTTLAWLLCSNEQVMNIQRMFVNTYHKLGLFKMDGSEAHNNKAFQGSLWSISVCLFKGL